jgi:hypothetical protein
MITVPPGSTSSTIPSLPVTGALTLILSLAPLEIKIYTTIPRIWSMVSRAGLVIPLAGSTQAWAIITFPLKKQLLLHPIHYVFVSISFQITSLITVKDG